jgi:CRISPR/Cas system-associated protein Cas10 (large subunit of type III CRISPR-Cas system)
MGNDEGACSALLDFQEAVKASAPILDFDLPAASNESEWLTRVDASVFHDSFWNNLDLTGAEEEKLRDAGLASLRALLKAAKTGQPGKYFAVVALDGDQIGKWLSGEKTPAIEKVITDKAVRYFREHIKGRDVEAWLKTNRPLSPSYHLQFSEALANFGLYCARRIVEAHHGQLIYSGGDDVLAMLPADEAIACAQGLRLAFQGSPELPKKYPTLFVDCPPGWIKLKDGDWGAGARRPAEPSWPLLVPGPKATVSVGIAIGHIKEPLQDMIHEARQAEKRAKADPQREVFDRQKNELCWKLSEGWGRDALAITLFKRSGELIRWGAKFDSSAFALLNELRAHYRRPVDDPNREMPISGKFPYRIAELLSRYETSTPLADGLRAIAAKELAWAISQQTWKDEEAERSGSLFRRGPFEQCCLAYLNELLAFRWKRKPDDAEQTSAARPLREFLNLFLTEAFIARQGD